MANNNINVLVKRDKLITSIKTAITSRETKLAEQKQIHDENDIRREKWEKQVIKNLGTPISTSVSNYDRTVKVTYNMPKDLAEPDYLPVAGHDYSLEAELKELKNALTLLEMSEEEAIKTSSYGTISRYL